MSQEAITLSPTQTGKREFCYLCGAPLLERGVVFNRDDPEGRMQFHEQVDGEGEQIVCEECLYHDPRVLPLVWKCRVCGILTNNGPNCHRCEQLCMDAGYPDADPNNEGWSLGSIGYGRVDTEYMP
jgi:hypothetical protein